LSSQVSAVIKDSKFDVYSILYALDDFKQQDIQIVVFAGISDNLNMVLSHINDNDMLLINNTSTLTDLSIDDTVYRLVPDDGFLAQALSATIYNEGKTRLIIMFRSDEWGINLADNVTTSFESLGGTVSYSLEYFPRYYDPDGTTDMSDLDTAVATAIDESTQDSVAVLCLSYEEGIDILEAAANFDNLDKVTWYGSDGFTQNNDLLQNIKASDFAAKVGMYCPIFAESDTEAYKAVKSEIQDSIGYEPYSWAMILYDAFRIAAQTRLDDSYDNDIDIIQNIFLDSVNTYDAVTGPLNLNNYGDRATSNYDFWGVSNTGGAPAWEKAFTWDYSDANIQENMINAKESRNLYRNKSSSSTNIFDGIDIGRDSNPTFGDLDGDGDLDMLAGEGKGNLYYYKNTGSSTRADYSFCPDDENPFYGFSAGKYLAAPYLTDLDGDGDLDLLLGASVPGIIQYYENIGTPTEPEFEQQTNEDNPFNGIIENYWNYSLINPVMADIDNDGDDDLIYTNERHKSVYFYRNTGNANNPSFLNETGTSTDPFNNFTLKSYSKYPAVTLAFADIDLDGDLDIVSSNKEGLFHYYQNTGTGEEAMFELATGTLDPFSSVSVSRYGAPALADINSDGNPDLLSGCQSGIFYYAKNVYVPTFSEYWSTSTGLTSIDVGGDSNPAFGDLDGDGDLDMLIGESKGNLYYYKNTGSSTDPNYSYCPDDENPFFGLIAGGKLASPYLTDLDGDGDLDLLIGSMQPGIIRYFENTGTPIKPEFEEQTDGNNPFNDIIENFWKYSLINPVMADIDNDGDDDLIYTNVRHDYAYFHRNTGDADNPIFSDETGTSTDPFKNYIFQSSAKYPNITLAFVDLNLDGKLDIVSSNTNGDIYYTNNIGSVSDPFFQNDSGFLNPFANIDMFMFATPIMLDIDNDGWVDLVTGCGNGKIYLFKQNRKEFEFEF